MIEGSHNWHLLLSGACHPHENMALDEALLQLPRGHIPVLRFYDWSPPGLSLGYFQKHSEFPPRRAGELGAVVTRRTTGGGAILHKGEITFSIAGDDGIAPFDGSVEESYHAIHGAVALGLGELGIEARLRGTDPVSQKGGDAAGRCFYKVTGFDLVAGGRKLVGSAQRRKDGRVVHHGSIPLDPNPLTPRAACIRGLAGRSLSRETVVTALQRGFETFFGIELEEWRPDETLRRSADCVLREKYGTREWIERR
jgi:lipoate-protein ligase A